MPQNYDTGEAERPIDTMLRRERALRAEQVAYGKEQSVNQGAISGQCGTEPAKPANFGLQGYSGQELSLDNIEDAMAYQPWHPGQVEQGNQVRDALVMAAKTILRNVPRSPRRTLALQHLISARMDANCAISFNGRF